MKRQHDNAKRNVSLNRKPRLDVDSNTNPLNIVGLSSQETFVHNNLMRICQANLLQQQVPVLSHTSSTVQSYQHQQYQASASVPSSQIESSQVVTLLAQCVSPNILTNIEHRNSFASFLPSLLASRNRTNGIVQEMVLGSCQAQQAQQRNVNNDSLRIVIHQQQEEDRKRSTTASIVRPTMCMADSGNSNRDYPSQENNSALGHSTSLLFMHSIDMRWPSMFQRSYHDELLKMPQMRSRVIFNNQFTPVKCHTSRTNQDCAISDPEWSKRYVDGGMTSSNIQSQDEQQTNRSLLVHDSSPLMNVNAATASGSGKKAHTLPTRLVLPSCISQPIDFYKLSAHQCLLREQIEYFEAADNDVIIHIRGRNKAITVGQVGIRCKHCAHLPISKRQKGSTYFPSSKLGIYQAAQNMSTTHIQCGLCAFTPDHIKNQFAIIMADRHRNENGAGRPYWAKSASQSGLIDTEEHGIRFVFGSLPPGTRMTNNTLQPKANENLN